MRIFICLIIYYIRQDIYHIIGALGDLKFKGNYILHGKTTEERGENSTSQPSLAGTLYFPSESKLLLPRGCVAPTQPLVWVSPSLLVTSKLVVEGKSHRRGHRAERPLAFHRRRDPSSPWNCYPNGKDGLWK